MLHVKQTSNIIDAWNRMINVSIVEDDAEYIQLLKDRICHCKDIKCLGAYKDCKSALNVIENEAPDVLLLDIKLPGMLGVKGIPLFKSKLPKLEIIMLTNYTEEELIFESLCNGATGYLLKSSDVSDIIAGIREAVAGGAPMSMSIARMVAESFHRKPPPQPLTQRELEVLDLLRKGLNNQAIAEELNITLDTIKYHNKNIYRKLEVCNRSEAIIKR